MRYLIGMLIVSLLLTMMPTRSYAAADPNRLHGTLWKLLRYGAENAPTLPVGQQAITLSFGANGIGGSGGCNVYGGSYRIEGENISFSNIFSTLIACEPEEIAKQEQAYFQALRKATRYRFDDGLLIINYSADESLVFTRLLSFADSTWQLLSYGEADAQTSVLPERPITLALTADGASGSSGCNTYRAMPTYREESIRFERIISTRMACSEALMAQERAYLEALGNVQDYRVVNGQLVLRYGERGRLTFVRVPTFTESAWQLTAYGAPNALIPAAGEVTLRFVESRAEGSTACSAYSASYEVSGDSLSFSAFVSAQQPCLTAELSQQEQAFLKALERVTHYAQLGDEFILHYGAGERLIFKRTSAQ